MAQVAENKKTGESNLRKIALQLVMQIMEEGAFCDKALHQAFESYSLEKRDRSFIMRLTEGTVERCIELDYIINQFSKCPVSKMKPVIRNILRLSVYQIFYMDQVPDSAACNEAVKLAEARKMYNLKGFVNGVLRNIVRKKEAIVYPEEKDFISYASVRYSMPEWIIRHFFSEQGKEATKEIFQKFLEEERSISIRCMQSRFSVQEVKESLQQEGVTVSEGKLLPYALSISEYSSIKELQAFQQGMFQVQDESSMMAGQIADIQKGEVVIDVCAAPGGKTFHAADILQGSGKVIAADLTKEKVALLRENCDRLQCQNVEILQNDATVLREEWIEKADVVIADLPCSGLGVIGKKCDIKYKTKQEDIIALAKIQRQIVSVVSQYVKPGGRLIFSTCTIAKKENEENVKWIQENLPFQTVSIEEHLPEILRGKTGKEGYLQVLPNETGTDGFFLSCFQKQG
ncbi:MAG: 16S rRNA (cytosine(967)-C(5))-methyltransferase RsmB [Butyribacter sp.]|nr:16S rRNA (cytosine(967)-C(5))-methyltransferase RsmB [bacterium]MDY3855143.1 16S rRNA (cytosine(967)-C(5))-methyltransferase RsmB [Butyribacter sp.]